MAAHHHAAAMAAQQFVNVVDNLGLHGIRKGTDPRAVLGAIRSNGRKLTFTEVAAASQLFNITLDIMIEESTTAENICLGFDTLERPESQRLRHPSEMGPGQLGV